MFVKQKRPSCIKYDCQLGLLSTDWQAVCEVQLDYLPAMNNRVWMIIVLLWLLHRCIDPVPLELPKAQEDAINPIRD